MGKSKEYFEELRYTVTMTRETYKTIEGFDDVNLIGTYDAAMYRHYKNDAEWQEAEYFYKLAREKKKDLEFKIKYKMIKNE
mgnify:FL=1